MALTLNDGFKVNSPRALDMRYGKIVSGRTTPYASKAEALAMIPSAYRHVGLTINISGEEWWWKNGLEDVNLLRKFTEGKSFLFVVKAGDEGNISKIIPDLAGYLFFLRRDAMPMVYEEEYQIEPGGGFSIIDENDPFVLNQRFELTITNSISII